MEEYKINFDLDSKIAWNRHRLRELFEMYKKIENYYPLYFAFLGFIGIYYFDFIILLLINFSHWFFLATLITTIGIICSGYYMGRIVFTTKWNQDSTPRKIYKDMFDRKTIQLREGNENPTLAEIELEVRENYLSGLEEMVTENFTLYSQKKKFVNRSLKLIVITLIIYSFNITYFKYLNNNTMAKTKDDYEKEVTQESEKKDKDGKKLITEKKDNKNKKNLNKQNINNIIYNTNSIQFNPEKRHLIKIDSLNNSIILNDSLRIGNIVH